MKPPEIKAIYQLAEFQQLKTPWNELVMRMGQPLPYATHEWLTCWWEAFAEKEQVQILTCWQDDKLVAGLPLMVGKQRLGRIFNFHGYESTSSTESPGFAIPCSLESLAPFLSACRQHIAATNPRWEMMFWLRLQAGDQTLKTVQSSFTDADTRVLLKPYTGSYLLALQPDFEALFKDRSKAFVRDRTYKNNKLAKLGEVSLQTCTTFDETALKDFYRMENSGWKRATSILSHANKRKFYDHLARSFANDGRFLLSLLRLNGQPIAGVFGAVFNETFYFLKIGVDYEADEKIRKTSPGQALLFHLIRHCCAQNLKSFDFCGPFYEYERMWTDHIEQKHNVLILNQRRPLVKVYSLGQRLLKGRQKPTI